MANGGGNENGSFVLNKSTGVALALVIPFGISCFWLGAKVKSVESLEKLVSSNQRMTLLRAAEVGALQTSDFQFARRLHRIELALQLPPLAPEETSYATPTPQRPTKTAGRSRPRSGPGRRVK